MGNTYFLAGRKLMIRKILTAVVITGASAGALAQGIHADHAWIRLLPGDLPAAGYFTLSNDTPTAQKLVGIRTSAYTQAMMHESIAHNGTDQMHMVMSLTVRAHGQVRFSPGSYHVMFMQPRHPLKPGQHVAGQLTFQNGQSVPIDFITRNAAGE